MGRVHVCMPVAEDDGFRCFTCHRDMRAEMSEYDSEIDRQTKVASGPRRDTRGPGSGRSQCEGRDARLGLY